jgi:phosphatidylserine/phosphatidylglycerophosphate/cardiolipin synthase-like enzyme
VTTILTPRTTWRVHHAAATTLLIDGREYYRAFHEAALTARKSILLLGWQFDSDVELLRGEDLPPGKTPDDVQLVSLIHKLCHERPALVTRVLAWDHSMWFALERQLLQKLYFADVTGERVLFKWDKTVPFGGSHHQKVAIIDGRIAFFGSQDLCQSRWDDSTHRVENAQRTSRGTAHQPYHEVQVAVTGEAVASLVDLFVSRWYGATGERLSRDDIVADEPGGGGGDRESEKDELARDDELPARVVMPRARLGLARTLPGVIGREPVQEVGALFVSAIARAERLLYIESQYLTSRAILDALVARMEDSSRPKLEIVLVIPRKPAKLKEELTIGAPQILFLRELDTVAKKHGHAIGLYNVLAGMDGERPLYVYIHSKLAIVDDQVLIVGSANLTNRSLTIDSEIVAAYEAGPEDDALRETIRQLRMRLLEEHVFGARRDEASVFAEPEGLVARLDELAAGGEGRLRKHDLRDDEPSALLKAVHELTAEVLDPWDGETLPAA